MHQFALHFNFREPYQVLVDEEMIQECARFKMDLLPALERTFHGKVKPSTPRTLTLTKQSSRPTKANKKTVITQCTIRHLYLSNTEHRADKSAWIATAKTFERRRCGHQDLENPVSSAECLLSVVDPKSNGTNKHRYAVATQDPDVRRSMRQIPGVPLVYVNRSVMILEPMGAKTEAFREREERGKIRAGIKGVVVGEKRKRDDDDVAEDTKDAAGGERGVVRDPKKKKARSGPKGPNPLSVKKAKPVVKEAGPDADDAVAAPATEKRKSRPEMSVAEPTPQEDGEGGEAAAKKRRKRKHKAAGVSTAADSTTTTSAITETEIPSPATVESS